MSIQRYGKLTATDLRLLLGFVDQLGQEENEAYELLAAKRDKIFPAGGRGHPWCHLYELPTSQMFSAIIHAYGMQDAIRSIAISENQVLAMADLIQAMNTEDTEVPEGEALIEVISLVQPIMNNLRCMMAYGCCINDLIKTAREGKLRQRDQALLRAIRIDPTVIGCQTAISRMSHAAVQKDRKFLRKIHNALSGKLGKREQSNYQKIRLILRTLHDAGASRLSDEQLKQLFVDELRLYSDPGHSAGKNLQELAHTIQKQKSTI